MKIQTIKTKLVDGWETVVYVMWRKPYKFIRNIKLKIRDAWWLITKGFKPDQAWDLSVWFCSITPKLIEHMAQHSYSCPRNDIVNLGRTCFPELFPNGPVSVEEGEKLGSDGYSIDYTNWTRILKELAHLIRNSNTNTQTAYGNEVEVVGAVYKTSPYLDKNGVKLRSIDFLDNESFKQWCNRETEIQKTCNENFKRAVTIYSQLLPYLWY